MAIFSLVYLFLDKYLVPFLFAIGLFYFIYGAIEYFIIGKGGDEGRAEHGREQFLKSIAWLVLAILVYTITALFGWISTFSFNSLEGPGVPRGGVEVDREDAVLTVPNVPTR